MDFFFDSSTQNHAEPLSIYPPKSVLVPKCAKLYQKPGFWRLVSVSWGWGEPSGGSCGNPGGPPAVTAFKDLYKNPLETPKVSLVRGKRSYNFGKGRNCIICFGLVCFCGFVYLFLELQNLIRISNIVFDLFNAILELHKQKPCGIIRKYQQIPF